MPPRRAYAAYCYNRPTEIVVSKIFLRKITCLKLVIKECDKIVTGEGCDTMSQDNRAPQRLQCVRRVARPDPISPETF